MNRRTNPPSPTRPSGSKRRRRVGDAHDRFLPRRLAWLLKQNEHYAPLLDTGLKLGALLLPIGGVVGLWLWTIFSGWLGWLGQAALPVTQAGDWLFLLAFGIVASLVFAALVLAPAAWTSIVRWNAPAGTTTKAIRQACGASAAATLLALAMLLWWGVATFPAIVAPSTIGGLAGGIIITRGRRPDGGVLAACLAFAASSLLILLWFSSLWTLLAPSADPLGKAWPIVAALGLAGFLVIVLAVSIIKPAAGILAGLLVTGFWVSGQASSEGGAMIASALYSANLGGGRPARIDQGKVAQGEICNLAIDARPVLTFEPGGCERRAALKRLRLLRSLGSLDRRRVLGAWRRQAEQRLSGAQGN